MNSSKYNTKNYLIVFSLNIPKKFPMEENIIKMLIILSYIEIKFRHWFLNFVSDYLQILGFYKFDDNKSNIISIKIHHNNILSSNLYGINY